ncbi:MAG: hypothetical protein AB1782_00695 [Cyanobacteriota bacterium]
MKKLLILFSLLFITLITIAGCQKTVTVNELPNILFKLDLTPGEEEKEIAVFLYTSRDNFGYEITNKGEDYLILNLNNTLLVKKARELNIEGLDELVSNARIVQIIQEKVKDNPLITRIIFKLKDPETKLKIIIQVQEIDIKKAQKTVDDSKEAAMAISGIVAKTNGNYHTLTSIIIIVGFWVICGLIIIVYWVTSKDKKI